MLTGSISGIKNGDAITATYSTSATVATGVGSYAVLPTAVDAIPSRLGNYDVTLVNAYLSAEGAVDVPRRTSRRSTGTPPVLTGSISGIKNGDAITATYSTSATVATGSAPTRSCRLRWTPSRPGWATTT